MCLFTLKSSVHTNVGRQTGSCHGVPHYLLAAMDYFAAVSSKAIRFATEPDLLLASNAVLKARLLLPFAYLLVVFSFRIRNSTPALAWKAFFHIFCSGKYCWIRNFSHCHSGKNNGFIPLKDELILTEYTNVTNTINYNNQIIMYFDCVRHSMSNNNIIIIKSLI